MISFKLSYINIILNEIFWNELFKCENLKILKIIKYIIYGELELEVVEDKMLKIFIQVIYLDLSDEFITYLFNYPKLLNIVSKKKIF